jgi:SAM-dependent methyltransferase
MNNAGTSLFFEQSTLTMIEFWNKRYAETEFAYGTKPNRFFKEQILNCEPGRILFPGEGEGRNAVYAAQLGFEAVAFDPSVEGINKAKKLADKFNVTIDYRNESYDSIQLQNKSFDYLVLIFAHMPATLRPVYHRKMIEFLKPGGKLILQGFSKEQITRSSGGPKDLSMLFSIDELKSDFNMLSDIIIEKKEEILNEGPFHQGPASVIEIIGKK